MSRWFRHSRRTLPRNRSHSACCRGARYAARSSAMPLAAATPAEGSPYLRSLSRIRYRGRWSKGVASRGCWATQASVGWRVTPTWTTRREPSSMAKKAWSGPEEVGDRQEVAAPDVGGMVAQEGGPGRARAAGRARPPQVALDRALAH